MNELIINEYMNKVYPNKPYYIRQGNDCQWVIMGNINMYFIIRDNKIIRIDGD
jgi:hypothetical protein